MTDQSLWFRPLFTREQAQKFLENHGNVPGTFVIRAKTMHSNPNIKFAITQVLSNGQYIHALVSQFPKGFMACEGQCFPTLNAMVAFYLKNHFPEGMQFTSLPQVPQNSAPRQHTQSRNPQLRASQRMRPVPQKPTVTADQAAPPPLPGRAPSMRGARTTHRHSSSPTPPAPQQTSQQQQQHQPMLRTSLRQSKRPAAPLPQVPNASTSTSTPTPTPPPLGPRKSSIGSVSKEDDIVYDDVLGVGQQLQGATISNPLTSSKATTPSTASKSKPADPGYEFIDMDDGYEFVDAPSFGVSASKRKESTDNDGYELMENVNMPSQVMVGGQLYMDMETQRK